MSDDVLNFEIGTDELEAFTPSNVRRAIITANPAGPLLSMSYASIDDVPIIGGDIIAAVNAALDLPAGTPPPLPIVQPGEITSPLDINCDAQTVMLLVLSTDWTWRYTDSKAGFGLKKSASQAGYGGLTYVVANPAGGWVHKSKLLPSDICMALYFNVSPPANGMGPNPVRAWKDGFNLLVELAQVPAVDPSGNAVPRTLGLVIDPDVRNPGGTGNGFGMGGG